jgi:prepilin-type N-terminal cleavage/methylation domain-containing protein
MMKRSERGFTLIEMLISLAIMSAIVGGVAMTTTALLTHPKRSTNQNIVLQQVQNAGYWISRDVQVAKTISYDAPNGFPLNLGIPVNTNPANDYSVSYFFDGNQLVTGSSETVVANYIDIDNTTFNISASYDNTYELTVQASKDTAVVERSYEITQRINST